MKTALDLPPDQLDTQEQAFIADVREHGWHHTRVFDDDAELPDFSYSTGFSLNLSFPEIVVFSLPPEVSHSVLWDIFRDLKSGATPTIGTPTPGIFGNASGVLLPVARKHYQEHFGWSRWFYGGDEFDCLQLFWPDTEGRFQWELGFDDHFRDSQPDLTEQGWLASMRQ